MIPVLKILKTTLFSRLGTQYVNNGQVGGNGGIVTCNTCCRILSSLIASS